MHLSMCRLPERPLRILCISATFVPVADSEAFCGAKMVSALVEAGAEVTVFRCANYKGVGARDTSRLWHTASKLTIDVPVSSQREVVTSILMATRYRARFYARWIGAVVRKAQVLDREHRFGLVYSRSLPMFSHIAGYWCSKVLRLPWVANINDPWDLFFFPGVTRGKASLGRMLSRFWLRRTLRTADLVTYPSARLRDYHLSLAGIDHPSEIIPHVGFDLPAVSRPASDQAASFTLVHVGKLGTNEITGRSSKALLLGLREFLNTCPSAVGVTKLILVGPEDPATQAWIDELQLHNAVKAVGRVSYEESLTWINSATICVLVEANTQEGIYFPSKLVDYISADKPVLALSPRVGVIADMAARGGILRVDPDDAEAVKNALADLYSDFKDRKLQSRVPAVDLACEVRPRTVAGKFITAVTGVISQSAVCGATKYFDQVKIVGAHGS